MTTWSIADIFSYGLVFARFSGFLHFMPGISDNYVPHKVRLLFALTLACVITPVVQTFLPPAPSSSLNVFVFMSIELIIGLAAGIMLKIMMSTLEIIGTLYGYQIGLANAFAFSPATSQQVGLPSAFLGSLILILIFSTGLYQHFLRVLVDSYEIFSPNRPVSFSHLNADFLKMGLQAFQASFSLSLQLGGPVIIFGFILMMIQGLLSRLVPQLQIYFILQPLQLLIGFLLLVLTLGSLTHIFLINLEQFFIISDKGY